MKNKLADLNNHLFAQLERLGEEGLTAEQLEIEAKRAEAIVAVSDQVVKNTAIQLQAVKLAIENGAMIDPMAQLLMIEGRAVQK